MPAVAFPVLDGCAYVCVVVDLDTFPFLQLWVTCVEEVMHVDKCGKDLLFVAKDVLG